MEANDTPGTLVNQWTSTKGTKGTTVVVLMVVGPLIKITSYLLFYSGFLKQL